MSQTAPAQKSRSEWVDCALVPVQAPVLRPSFLLLGAALGLLVGLLLIAAIRTAIAPGETVGLPVVAIVAFTYTGGGVLIAAILSAKLGSETL